jgi:hypothetical protein
MESKISIFKKEGYLLQKNTFSKQQCQDLRNYLDTLQAKIKIPFTNIPWGWGNLINSGPFESLVKSEKLNGFCKHILGDNFRYLTLMVNNKAPWVGPSVEWHQESINMKTYASGCDPEKDWKNFLQIYVALDDQTVDNGCLRVFPGSHHFGLLSHYNMIGQNLGHKRHVSIKDLDFLDKKCGVKNVTMMTGDVLIFNHRLVHGSSSNHSNKNRRSIVLRATNVDENKITNKEEFLKETKIRTNFVVDTFSVINKKIKNKNKYSDFLVDKKND